MDKNIELNEIAYIELMLRIVLASLHLIFSKGVTARITLMEMK
jgi:hypothetical protein